MGSRSRWKTSTHRPTHSWSTPISRTPMKRITCSMLSRMWMWSRRKQDGQWNGWTGRNLSMNDWWPLLQLREYFFQAHSAPYSGWKKGPWCQDWLSLMNWFLEMRVFILISPATCTHCWRTNWPQREYNKLSQKRSQLKRSSSLNPCQLTWSASTQK